MFSFLIGSVSFVHISADDRNIWQMDEESAEERLLYNARHGDVELVRDLLQQRSTGELKLNIDCEGTSAGLDRGNKIYTISDVSTIK